MPVAVWTEVEKIHATSAFSHEPAALACVVNDDLAAGRPEAVLRRILLDNPDIN